MDVLGGCISSFSHLLSWAVGQMPSRESPLLPKGVTKGFSSQMPGFPHRFVGGSASMHIPGEGTGYKDPSWEVSFGGEMLSTDPATPL